MYSDSEKNFITHPKGIMSWLFTLDHKRIGIMYGIVIFTAFAAGGFFALSLRLELFRPGEQFLSQDQYNKFFTLHGAIMVFLFIIPSIPATLGNFCLPLLLGAKDVAFPRLNLASWYVYIVGATFTLYSIFTGAVDTGWTFYSPYSTQTDTSVISMTLGIFILGFSSIFTGLNFIVTVHKMRAPGMTWYQMPLFVWGTYATALIQVLATPVLGITLLLLLMEKIGGIGIFDPNMGGGSSSVSAFFLVLFTPRSVHYDPSGYGNY